MRFKIDFAVLGDAPYNLPVNYQSEISSWIHKVLHFENPKFISWLKEKSYLDASGEYRLFTFSDLVFSGHKHQDDKISLEKPVAGIVLSFYADKGIGEFIPDMFAGKEFKIGDMRGKTAFRVEKVSALDMETKDKSGMISLSCLSPMLIAEPGKTDGSYLSPDQKDFDKVFFKSLMAKYAHMIRILPDAAAGLSGLQDLKFELLGKPRAKVVKIKTDTPHQKAVKGYWFDFRIQAPEPLLQIGLQGGFGDLNHLGFGCCEFKMQP